MISDVPKYRGNRLHGMVERLRVARADLRDARQREDAAKGEVLAALNGRQALQVGDTVVRVRLVPPAPGSIITAAMVGERIGGRKGYRLLELIGPGDDDGEATAAPVAPLGGAGSPQPRTVSS